jgi:hypothetical protein
MTFVDVPTGDTCTYADCQELRARMPDREDVEAYLRGARLIYCREHAMQADPRRAAALATEPVRP